MRPYGQDKKHLFNYTDCHPKKLGKGWKNWWEVEINKIVKKRERQSSKLEMKKILNCAEGERLMDG